VFLTSQSLVVEVTVTAVTMNVRFSSDNQSTAAENASDGACLRSPGLQPKDVATVAPIDSSVKD
jgi:hypothetical protein